MRPLAAKIRPASVKSEAGRGKRYMAACQNGPEKHEMRQPFCRGGLVHAPGRNRRCTTFGAGLRSGRPGASDFFSKIVARKKFFYDLCTRN